MLRDLEQLQGEVRIAAFAIHRQAVFFGHTVSPKNHHGAAEQPSKQRAPSAAVGRSCCVSGDRPNTSSPRAVVERRPRSWAFQ
ncbi:hypothetical protein MRX96_035083 [Rhipicephalus microplus]